MTTKYKATLCDHRFRKLSNLEGVTFGRAGLKVNDTAPFTLGLPDYYFDLFTRGELRNYTVEIQRSVDGRAPQTFYYFVLMDELERQSKGEWRYQIGGFDANFLLLARIVAYAAGTAYAEKTDSADDVMKAYLRENLGSLAVDTARDLTAAGLTIEADKGLGVSLTKSAAWRGVMRTLQGLAASSIADGTPVFFGIVPTGRASDGTLAFEFRTRTGQWGADRTASRVKLSAESGNLRAERIVRDYSKEVTTVYGLGAGRDTARLVTDPPASESAREGATAWSRREATYDNSQITTEAALNDAANQRAIEGRPVLRMSGEIAETAWWHYGINYALGDKLTMTVRKLSLPVWVTSVGLAWQAKQESVTARVSSTTGIGTSGGSGSTEGTTV